LCACCVAVLVTWMSFTSGVRELRGVLSMLETYIVMSSLISRLILILMFRLILLHVPFLISLMDLTSYAFGSRENHFEPTRFGYSPHPHHVDCFPRRPGFSAGGSYTHFEPRYLDGSYFFYRGSRPTQPSGEVQRTVKTPSGCMVKCWISKIYLTNPSTESSIFSYPL
jgi:hypothetical protein